jgi:hypothetical protein
MHTHSSTPIDTTLAHTYDTRALHGGGRMMDTATAPPVRWIVGAESVPATEEQIRQVLALGERCAEARALPLPRWQGLVGSACKGPQTVGALRDLLSTLFLLTSKHSPELAAELREKNEQLADLLRVSV